MNIKPIRKTKQICVQVAQQDFYCEKMTVKGRDPRPIEICNGNGCGWLKTI